MTADSSLLVVLAAACAPALIDKVGKGVYLSASHRVSISWSLERDLHNGLLKTRQLRASRPLVDMHAIVVIASHTNSAIHCPDHTRCRPPSGVFHPAFIDLDLHSVVPALTGVTEIWLTYTKTSRGS